MINSISNNISFKAREVRLKPGLEQTKTDEQLKSSMEALKQNDYITVINKHEDGNPYYLYEVKSRQLREEKEKDIETRLNEFYGNDITITKAVGPIERKEKLDTLNFALKRI